MRKNILITVTVSLMLLFSCGGNSIKSGETDYCTSGNCYNGKGTRIYNKNEKYTGDWVSGRRHGTGTMIYSSGDVYSGQWEKDLCQYHGIYKFANGDIFEGEFNHGGAVGMGKYTYADGSVEEGVFDSFNYTGVIKLPQAGEDEKVKISKIIDVKAANYEIIVANPTGLKMGDKLFIEIDHKMCALEVFYPMMTISRCKMIGESRNLVVKAKKDMPVFRMMKGFKRGTNVFLFPNGNIYTGDYKDNLMHGKGEFTWTNGSKYTGEYKNGMRHGHGIYKSDGRVYTGEWKNGFRDGYGRLVKSDGSSYDGEFKNGEYNGQGTYIWPNGYKYTGEWKDCNMEGEGTMIYPDGTIRSGKWKDNVYYGK